jgi:hypothetical protein
MNLSAVTDRRTTLNLSSLELNRLGYDKHHIEAQNYYIKEDHTIAKLEGNSQTYDFSSLNEKFDLIFIDGDHHWQSVKKDTENVFRHLTHDKSIVVWHDITTNYSSIWWEVLFGIFKGVTPAMQSKLYHVRNTNCMVYLPFDIATGKTSNPYLPTSTFTIAIDEKI